MIIFAVIFCFLVVSTQAQVPVKNCPDVKVMQNFNITAYLGDWYEQARYPSSLEDQGKCVYTNYALNNPDNATDTSVKSHTEFINSDTNEKSILDGVATPDPDNEAKFTLKFSEPKNLTVPFWILGTDYTGFSVGFSCSAQNDVTGMSLFIQTRGSDPSQVDIDAAFKIIKDNSLPTSYLTQTEQDVCDY
ncbi:apolipoprotein D-like [Diabrotica undecimpunctata]|uniref:apolipoprotein D-like n=1 Tax=Diabrotica undecimpunctata TaxID=50387 RepID=UPI003B640F03